MSGEPEPTIDEVLKGLEVTMDQHIKVRDIIAEAMAKAWVLREADMTSRRKSMEMGKTLKETTEEILGVFGDEGAE